MVRKGERCFEVMDRRRRDGRKSGISCSARPAFRRWTATRAAALDRRKMASHFPLLMGWNRKMAEMKVDMKPWMIYRLPYGKFLKKDTEALTTIRKAGINLVSISPMNTTNAFGEPYSAYPPIWNYDESYDFSSLDRHIGDVLEFHPEARFFCAVDLNSPQWLARKISLDSFYSLTACSLHSEWLDLTTKYLNAFLEYTETKYRDRMAGYILACGRTMEWIDHSYFCAEELKSAYYEEWCGKQGVPALPIPNSRELKSARHDFVRDPEKEAHVIQWLHYVNDLMADLAIHFITSARKKIRKERKIGIFFGYPFHMMTEGQHECERVFDTAPPDFVIGASCNSTRDIGSASGYIATLQMLKRRNIAYLHECDRITSTTNRDLTDHIRIEGKIWNAWKTPEEDVAGLRREMSLSLINRFHLWWFNIWGNSYASPEVKKAIAQMQTLWEKYAALSSGSNAGILLVHDPESNYFVNFYDHPKQYFLAHKIRDEFSDAALPFDTAAWRDLDKINLDSYRMIIFQSHVLSDARRNEILKKFVCRPDRLIVWIYAPGILSGGKYDPDHVRVLTGVPFGVDDHEIKTFPTHRSVYYAKMTDLTAAELRRLAKEAGVHCYTPEGNAVWSSDEFLMVHRKGAADVPVLLPRKAKKITELFSGRVVAENTDSFTEHFSDSGTCLYFME